MLTKAPGSTINYGVDWSVRYPTNTLSAPTAVGSGVTVSNVTLSGRVVQFTASGGVAITNATILVTITVDGVQIDEYTFPLLIAQT